VASRSSRKEWPVARYYGSVISRTGNEVHRLGDRNIDVTAASTQGAVRVHLWDKGEGREVWARVTLEPWHYSVFYAEVPSRSETVLLFEGPILWDGETIDLEDEQ
jgi:hypothetical protein